MINLELVVGAASLVIIGYSICEIIHARRNTLASELIDNLTKEHKKLREAQKLYETKGYSSLVNEKKEEGTEENEATVILETETKVEEAVDAGLDRVDLVFDANEERWGLCRDDVPYASHIDNPEKYLDKHTIELLADWCIEGTIPYINTRLKTAGYIEVELDSVLFDIDQKEIEEDEYESEWTIARNQLLKEAKGQ